MSNLIYLYSLDNFEGVWHAPPSFLQSDMWLKGSFLYLSHALNFMPLSSFDYGLILWQMSKTFKKILQKAKSISFNLLVITKVFFQSVFIGVLSDERKSFSQKSSTGFIMKRKTLSTEVLKMAAIPKYITCDNIFDQKVS